MKEKTNSREDQILKELSKIIVHAMELEIETTHIIGLLEKVKLSIHLADAYPTLKEED